MSIKMTFLFAFILYSAISLAERTILTPLNQDSLSDIPSDQCGVNVITNDDERIELFALGLNNEIYHRFQTFSGKWSNWVSIGGNFSSGVQVVKNVDGRLEVFAIGKDDVLYHNWQTSAGSDFQANWVALGGPFVGSPSIMLNSEGNIAIFVRGKVSRSLMYNHQVHNATAVFWAGWSNLGGILTSDPSALLTAESLIHVFVRGVDKGLFEKKQVPTHTGTVMWSKYEGLGGLLSSNPSIPAALNSVNLLEVFVRQADRAIWYKKQVSMTNDTESTTWSEWQSLGGKMSSGPSVVVNSFGLVEVYARGMNREIFVKRQKSHDSPEYFLWESLKGDSASTPRTLQTSDGTLHLFHRGSDMMIHHKVKKVAANGQVTWSDWSKHTNDNGVEAFFQLYSC